MIINIEIDTDKYDFYIKDKTTGTEWILAPEPEMDGAVISPDTNADKWIR